MRLFKGDKVYDFMAVRKYWIGLSLSLTIVSLIAIFSGRAKLGTDFLGGTEVELAFKAPVEAAAIRKSVEDAGFSAPTVIKVDDAKNPNRYMVRVQEVSTISHEKQVEIEKALCAEAPDAACTEARKPTEVKFSPGGDKITVRYRDTPDVPFVKERISGVKQIALRPGEHNPLLQSERENKVEIQLMSKGDQLMAGLRKSLGENVVPDQALRTEWIGPRAGAQLRDAAVKSVAISIIFIMAYIAFRFDLRFAPGCVVALIHDAVGTIGIFVLLGKEINLTTVAAALYRRWLLRERHGDRLRSRARKFGQAARRQLHAADQRQHLRNARSYDLDRVDGAVQLARPLHLGHRRAERLRARADDRRRARHVLVDLRRVAADGMVRDALLRQDEQQEEEAPAGNP